MQTTQPIPFTVDEPGTAAVGFFAHARTLYDRITGGHDGLGFNVRGVPSVTAVGADGKRRPVVLGYGQGEDDDTGREWRPARDLVTVDGDRRLVARVLTPQAIAAHVRGGYAVAFEAAGWVEWVAIDIDAHANPADGDDGPRLAKARARRVLGQVLEALHCGGDRWPVLLQSPGGGFHLWLPITRGVGGDHRWPASWAAAWFRDHLAACGVELRDGVCEVYPSGRRLRAPCGRGSVLLRVVGDDVTDPHALMPWPGTATTRARWVTHGDVLTVRRVGPMLRVLLGEWERQRRTIADWLGRPEAAWDPCWGFLGRRGKNGAPADSETCDRSQEVDDVSDAPPGRGTHPARERPSLVVIAGDGVGNRGSALGLPASFSKTASGAVLANVGEVEADPDSALLKGPAFWRKVHRLLADGVTAAGTRHDAVLTLCFAWGAAAGLSDSETIDRLITWCGAHAHGGSRLTGSARFTAECIREGWHYLRSHGPRWPFRGRGRSSSVALGVLVTADRRVLERVDERVRTEAGAVLAFLAGKADGAGVVADPVEWATGLVRRLLGDRRVVVEGERRRAAVMAVEELARLGVITRHSGHAVGRHGRRWSVWYRFGSGELPAVVTVDRASWDRAGRREVLVPSLAMPAPVIAEAAQDAPGAAEGSAVEVREVAARPVREGVLRALSEAGAPVRLVLVPGPEAPGPARPGYRAAWWVRQWRGSPTVGAFQHAHEGAIVVGPRQAAAAGVARLVTRARRAPGGSYDPPPAGPRVRLVTSLLSVDHGVPAAGEGGARASHAPRPLYEGSVSAMRGAAPGGSYDPPPAVEVEATPVGAVELAPGLRDMAPDLAAVVGPALASWEARQRAKRDTSED